MCQAHSPEQERLARRCGWLAPASYGEPSVPGLARRVRDDVDADGQRRSPWTVCGGYTTALPEVREAVELRPQVKLGTIRDYLELGPRAHVPPLALLAQAVLEGAINECQAASMEEAQERRKEGGHG